MTAKIRRMSRRRRKIAVRRKLLAMLRRNQGSIIFTGRRIGVKTLKRMAAAFTQAIGGQEGGAA